MARKKGEKTIRRPVPTKGKALVMALEPRWMFDGAAATDAAHAVPDAAAAALIPTVAAPVEVRAADPTQDGGKKEVVFVDTSVSGYKALEAAVAPGIEIAEIAGGQSGLAQMATWAQTHSGYDSISVIATGAAGRVDIGADVITDSTLSAPVVQAELAMIGSALKAGGDLLIYGSDIAQGDNGQRLMLDLAAATGADIALSDGAIGPDGNWGLNQWTGTVEATRFAAPDYTGDLYVVPTLLQAGDSSLDNGLTEITFIDANIADWQTLAASVRPGVEVVLIDGNADGLREIAAYLGTRTGVDAIHMVSHGSLGELYVGTDDITDTDVSAYAGSLARISAALKPGGDVLLYGCDIGQGTDGQQFVTDLAAALHANVAASTDLTGPAALGGNWVLEVQAGTVSVDTAFDSTLVQNYAYDLGGSYTATTGTNVDTAGATTGLIGAGKLITFNALTITSAPTTSALLLLNAYDVDYGLKNSSGVPYAVGNASSEWDGVYIQKSGAATWQFVGYLTGSNNTWNYTTLDVTSYVQANGAGSYVVRVVPDDNGTQTQANNGGRWVVGVSSAQLVVDGGDHVATLSNPGETGSSVTSTVTATATGTYTVEYNLIDSTGHVVATLSKTAALTANTATAVGGTLAMNTNFYTSWSQLPTGAYTLQISLLDSAGKVQDTKSLAYNNTSSGSVPATTGIAALITGLSSGSWTGTSLADLQHLATTDTSPLITGSLSKVASTTTTSYVDVYADGVYVGTSSVAAGATTFQLQFGAGSNGVNSTTALLPAGVHSLTAIYTNSAAATPGVYVSYTEGGSPVTLDSGLILTGSGTIKGAIVAINSGVAGDTLAAVTTGTNITATFAKGILTLSGSDTVAHYQQVLQSVTYSSSSSDPTNQGAATSRVISWQVKDRDSNWSTAKTTNLGITTVNSAPVLGGGGNSTTFYKSWGAIAADSAINIVDDNAKLSSATVKLTTNFNSNQDVLAFSNTSTSTYGNIAASYDSSTGTLSLTSSGATATAAQWAAALAAVTYNNTSATPSTATRTVTFQVNDGALASNTITGTVAVSTSTPSNRAPALSGAGSVVNWSSSSVTVDKLITVSDADGTKLTSATVSIVSGFDSNTDTLSFSGSSKYNNNSSTSYGNITGSYDSGTGILTLSSSGGTATLAQWQAALQAVKYSNSSRGDTSVTNRIIAFQANDGKSSNNLSNIVTAVVTVGKTFSTSTQSSSRSASNGVNVGAGTTVIQTTAYSSSAPVYQLLIDAPSSITPTITSIDGTVGLANTTDRVPTISGTSAPGVTVTVYAGATTLGTATADLNGNWSFVVPNNEALANNTYALTAEDMVNTNTSSPYSLTVNSSAPTVTVSNIHISNDTGTDATDFVTAQAAQTITATLSAGLTSGQKLYGSLDGGTTWIDVTSYVTGTAVTWTGTTLKSGYQDPSNYVWNSIQFKVSNASGDGLVAAQDYLLVGALADPTITGASFLTASTPTITGTADPNSVITLNYTAGGQARTGTAYPNPDGTWSFTLPGPLADGSYTFTVTETDPVSGAQSSVHPSTTLTVDSTLPYASAPITISADTGSSTSDYTTKTASQTIRTTLNQALTAGQALYGSVDGGVTWTNVTSFVSGTSVTWTGASLAVGPNLIEFQARNTASGARGNMVSQGYVLDITAPALPSGGIVLNPDAMTFTLNFSELGSGFDTSSVPTVSTFTLTQNGSSVSLSSSNTTITMVDSDTVMITTTATTASAADVFKLSYSGTALRDVAGNQVAAFSNVTVVNPLVATAVADTVSATEAGGIHNATLGVDPSGNVLINDVGGGTLTVTAVVAGATIDNTAPSVDPGTTAVTGGTVVTGSYGTLTIGADGSYNYAVNNSNATVEALAAGQSLSETFSYEMTDGTGATATAAVVVTINGAADSPGPTLDPAKSPVFTDETVGSTSVPVGAVGTLVSQLVDIGGSLSNMTSSYPAGHAYGIAITGTNTTTGNGTWYYTSNGGTTWQQVGTVSNTSALLLTADANTRLYYVSNGTYLGTITDGITFRAWDTGAGAAGTKTDTSVNGGTSSFSSATDTAAIAIVANPNVAPTWVSDSTTLTINAGATGNLNTLLAVSDSDSGQTETWSQYTAPGHGTLSLANGSISAASGGTNLLPGSTFTYTPNTGYAGTDTFTVYLTDGKATISKTITVTVVPQAPTITGMNASTDSGVSSSDKLTNANILKFYGTGAAYGSGAGDGSDVVVFLDTRSNLAGSAGAVPNGDVSGTISATVGGAGAWGSFSDNPASVSINAGNLADGTYYVYAYDRALVGTNDVSVLSSPYSITIDRTAPTLTAMTPANNATNVALNTGTLSLSFSETVAKGTGSIVLHDVTTNTDVAIFDAATGKVLASDNTTVLTASGAITGWNSSALSLALPSNLLVGGHNYSVRVAATAVQDVAGNSYGGIADNVTDTFTTVDTAPTYTAATTSFTVTANSNAFDLTSYLHVSDVDTAQTETWTVSSAPDHGGTVTITGATATSGGANLAPGGTITYKPNPGFYGTETFTIRVSDGAGGTADRTFTFYVDAPASVTASSGSAAYTEQAAAVVVDPGVTIADADGSHSGNWTNGVLKAQITANAFSADSLALNLPASDPGNGGLWISGGTSIRVGATQIGTLATSAYASASSGVALTITLTVDATNAYVQQLARAVTFADTNQDPAAGTRTVTFTVADGQGVQSTASRNVTFTLSNDAPTLTATASGSGGSPASYVEKAASATALFSAASIGTIEAGQSIKALTLTIANLADGASETLVVDGTSVALTSGTSGTTASHGFAYSVSVTGTTATVTLSKTDTTANWQTLVNGLGYKNTSSDPGTATNRVVTLTSVQDSGGTSSGTDATALNVATTVAVRAVNDAPTLTATGLNPNFDPANPNAVSLFSGASLSTVEAGQQITRVRLQVTNLNDGVNEVLSIDGTDVALSDGTNGATTANAFGYTVAVVGNTATVTIIKTDSTANWQTMLNGLTYQNLLGAATTGGNRVATLSYVQDSGGTANNGANDATPSISSTIAVAALTANDQPVITVPGVQNIATTTSQSIGGISVSDVTYGGTVTATVSSIGGLLNLTKGATAVTLTGNDTTSVSLSGSYADLNTVLGTLKYSATATTSTTDTITVTFNDGATGTSNGALSATPQTITVNLTANAAPAVTGPATLATADNVASNLNGLAITDTDIAGGAMKVTLGAGHGTLHLLSSTGLTVQGDGTGSVVLSGTLADVTAALANGNVQYTATQYYSGTDTISVGVDDQQTTAIGGNKTGALAGGVAVTVSHTDVAPSIAKGTAGSNDTGSGEAATGTPAAGAATLTTYDTAAHALNLGATEVTDSDNNGATVTAVLTTDSHGTLHIDTAGGATISSNSNGSSAVTFTGTLAQINAALASLTYARDNSAGTGTVHLTIKDGNSYTPAAGYGADIATVTAVANDAPTLANLPAVAVTVADKSAHTIASLNGNAAITIADNYNGGAVSVTVSTSGVGAGASKGLVSVDTATSGVTVSGGANGSASVTISGTVAQVNAALAQLSYTATYDALTSGKSDTITIHVDDGYGTGIGGARTVATDGTITVNLTPNDVPVVKVNGTTLDATPTTGNQATMAVSDTAQHALSGITVSDTYGGNTIRVTVSDTQGTLHAVAAGGATIGGDNSNNLVITGTVADVNTVLAGLKYTTTATATGTDTVSVSVDDLGSGRIGGHLTNASPNIQAYAVTLTGNDTPTITLPVATPSYTDANWHYINENSAGNLSIADGNYGTLTVTLSDLHGLLKVDGATATANSVTIDSGNGTSAVQIHGSTVAAINAVLATLQYQTSVVETGSETIAITVNDGNASAIGGAKQASTSFSASMVGNDTPVVSGPSTAVLTGDNHSRTLSGFSFTDTYAGATVVATVSASYGSLHLTAAAGASIDAGTNDTGTVVVRGSKAAVNSTLLNNFTYQETGTLRADTVTVSVNDGNSAGIGGAKSGSAAVSIVVAPNDKPVLTAGPNETYHSEVKNNLVSGFSFTDTYYGDNITLTVSDNTGLLNLSGAGITVTGNGSNRLSVTGSIAAINDALKQLQYTSSYVGQGSDSLTVTITDNNTNGVGGALSASATIGITLLAPPAPQPPTPAADAPKAPVPTPPPPPPSDTLVTVVRARTTADTGLSASPSVMAVQVPGVSTAVTNGDSGRTSPAGFQVALASVSGGVDALTANKPISDSVLSEGARISVTIPPDAFAHTQQTAVIALVATRLDGSALPGWIVFDPKTGKFEGEPPPGFRGEIIVKVVARDSDGREAAQTFKIDIGMPGEGQLQRNGDAPGVGGERSGKLGTDEKQAALRPGRPGLTAQLKALGQQGREAQRLAFLEMLKSGRAA